LSTSVDVNRLSYAVFAVSFAVKFRPAGLTLKRALVVHPKILHSLQEQVGASHILFGSDYPFAPEMAIDLVIRGIKGHDGFDEPARAMIERENALELFPCLI